MATIVHDDFRDAQLGLPTHSVVDFDTDVIASSLLDLADSGTITVAFIDYAEVNTPTVLHDEEAHGTKTLGVVATGVYDAGDLTMPAVAVIWPAEPSRRLTKKDALSRLRAYLSMPLRVFGVRTVLTSWVFSL